MTNIISIFFWLLTIVFVIITVIFTFYSTIIDYQYERVLGSYMETATDTITPESFKEQMLLFKDAINTSGLTEDDYGAMWFKKPDNSMKFQMQHIDSIIGRADAMLQWKNTVYNNGTQTLPTGQISAEAFRDVYNDKMTNLKTYIHAEGYRSDWIAKDSWYVKYHPIMYFDGSIIMILMLMIILFSFLGGMTWDSFE
jgi:hypothetical protein